MYTGILYFSWTCEIVQWRNISKDWLAANETRKTLAMELISVVIRLEWSVDRDAKVRCLIRCQFCQFHSKMVQVQCGHFLVKLTHKFKRQSTINLKYKSNTENGNTHNFSFTNTVNNLFACSFYCIKFDHPIISSNLQDPLSMCNSPAFTNSVISNIQ